jgi:hypothetical protein
MEDQDRPTSVSLFIEPTHCRSCGYLLGPPEAGCFTLQNGISGKWKTYCVKRLSLSRPECSTNAARGIEVE